ncbi:glycosyltransferase [Candidatus Bathyarchaeota archaeon]|nr:glycosyltransferase [Candidatus Bathyarchaeota archaeon]
METYESKQKIHQSQKLFNKAVYQANTAYRKGDFNSSMAWAQIAAHFAFIRHPGFYASPALESILLKIAEKIKDNSRKNSPVFKLKSRLKDSGKMRFLYVVTEFYGSGGHSAFIARWIKNTSGNSVHSLVSTAKNGQLPEILASAIEESGGWNCSLSDMSQSLVERALFLRQLANSWADVVVLFVHPFDPVPTVAFGVEGGPPVIFCNHADHAFWLGVSITDVSVDYHSLGSLISRKRRGINGSKILPIPLLKGKADPHDKLETRKKLGLEENEIMMLTVAREEKFLPYDGYNYFEVMVKFLKQNPKTKLFVVGPNHQGRWVEASALVGGRIKALGTLDRLRLEDLFAVADVYVSSFPCGSGTAMLEAGMHGVPMVGLQFMLPHITGQDDVAFTKLPVHASSISKLTASLEQVINNPYDSKERAAQVKENIEREHCLPGWNLYLDNVLQSLPSQHHLRKLTIQGGDMDSSDFYLAYLDSEMLSDELVEHSFGRLVRVYSKYLPRNDSLMLQAKSLYDALPKVYNLKKAKEYLYNLKEFIQIGLIAK